MKVLSKSILAVLVGASLALFVSLPVSLRADEAKTAITGGWAWSIMPPFSGPGEIIPVPNGNVHLRDVAASGVFSFTGEGVTLNATITANINGNLDETLSGPIYGSTILTAVIDGVETVIFAGTFAGQSVGLLTEGKVMLQGRGPYAGLSLHFYFTEVPPMDVYTFEGYLLNEGNSSPGSL
jgi:hypothetical protein